MAKDDDIPDDLSADEKDLQEAKKRFAFCEDFYSYTYGLGEDDYQFGHGDSDNMAQWPDQVLSARELNQKPMLTSNKVRIHCQQIINDAKQNKSGIVVHPTTNEATYEAAEVYEDVVRNIENFSHADQAYDLANENQVYRGIGYCRVVTEYSDPDGFEQNILLRGIKDPRTVFLDPDAQEKDRSDAEYGFVFDDMSKDKFKREFPDADPNVSNSTIGSYDTWVSDDHVRVAEYWKKTHKRVVLVSIIDPQTGERRTAPKKDISLELIKQIRKEPEWDYRERDSDVVKVECIKIAGNSVVDRYDWAGQWIPIVPAIGEEVMVDGRIDFKGHVRYLKDDQRMYNYNNSAAVEAGALQTKIPFLGPAAAFEGYEEYYANANNQNLGYLPYKHRDDEGNDIAAPVRLEPPRMSEVYLKGMEIAQQGMMMSSGQYQSQMGEQENAKSGKAIAERQRQGDNATYHFVDGQATMIRHLGRIIVDLIPKIYDTQRVMRIRGDDGTIKNIVIDPNAQQAAEKREMENKQEVMLIFNPNIGKYGVEVDVGPSFATRRQEAWNAIIQILTQSPNLIPIVGDLLFQNADFPGADEIAIRLRRMAPPQALGDGPPPQDQAMQAHIGQLTQLVAELNQKLASKDAETNIRAFEAETKRLQAIGNAGPIVSKEQAQPLIAQSVSEMTQGGAPEQFGEASAQPIAPGQGQQPQMPMTMQAQPPMPVAPVGGV